MLPPLDYVAHLVRESARFAETLHAVPGAARVPSCPDWDAADLIWHLAEVQWFWATVVSERVREPREIAAPDPVRPGDLAELRNFGARSSRELAQVLRSTPAETEVWTWAADQTVGFIRRRQAHEALIHRLDAELSSGHRTPLDAALATDGVDEILRVVLGSVPAWATLEVTEDETVRLLATDTEHSWLATLGRRRGVDPAGLTRDEPSWVIAPADTGEPVPAVVRATAADLDAWLWGRPPVGEVALDGDPAALADLRAVVALGVE